MTSLFIQPLSAVVNSDSLTISSSTMSQQTGETVTSGSSIATATYLAGASSDTYAVTVSLLSAPAGNTKLPVLRLSETTAANVSTNSNPGPLPLNSVVTGGTQAKIAPRGTPPIAVSAKFQVYLDAPEKVGTYVVRITPAILSSGSLSATAQTITITVTRPPTIFSDALTLSAATMTLNAGETSTPNASTLTVSYLSAGMGDTYSVTSSLVSSPAGNVSLPVLRFIETTSANVYDGSTDSILSLNSEIPAFTAAKISPSNNGNVAVMAKFQVYLNAPSKPGTYVIRLTPAILGNSGSLNAGALNLTITVPGAPDPTPTPVYSPPTETSTPDTYTASINITTALPSQLKSKNQTTSDLFLNFVSYANNVGDTASVLASLVAAPAGNLALPVLELVQTANSQIDTTPKFAAALSAGYQILAGSYVYMTGVSFPGAISARFKLYLSNPKKAGTYIVKVQPRITSGSGTAPTNGLLITFTVTRDPDTYPAAGDVVISNPGDITNKSDAVINASKSADSSNEVAVIRTTMKSASGLTTSLDSYTAVITGVGVLGSAALSSNINTTSVGRVITVKAGDAVTVYADGSAGEGVITIANYDGIVLGRQTVNFVDLTNQASAILALSFSSFPEKGTPMQLTALVNLPGTVRFTSNGKTLGSCARVVATGSPRTAVCQWKPPLAGSINVVARFTPTDQGISAVSTTKVLAIGRRSGKR
jgi:hypothetical protein